ncbi:MAG TPA: endonuclease/exonuclease/phosphatase family protein [Alphaproteobacteria bacterium]
MKLIQLNLWDGRLIRNIEQFLQDQQPDILCLQELEFYPDHADWHLAALKKVTGLEHHYFSRALGYKHFGKDCEWGNCIISRYPLLDKHSHFVHGEYDPDWYIGKDFNKRNVQSARVETPAGTFNIVNHHGLHVPGTKLGNDLITSVMQGIYDHIVTLGGPTILTGDFNLAPESPSLNVLNDNMRNLCVENNIETTRNFTAKRLVEVCDYIYVSRDIKVKNFYVPDDIMSDHQPLVLEL